MGFKAGAGDLGSDLKINDGTIKIKEQANAEGDTAAYGQLWVKSNTPNDLYFTNDAGNDVRITNGSSLAAAGSSSSVAADDIDTGDAAVNIVTTSGNITLDAQANNADVIIKVDDGGSSVTAVTFDGSDEGNAVFVNDLKLSSDASAIHFGADNEITLTHVHNTGLTLEASAASTPVLEIKNTHNGGTAGILKFNNTEGGQDGADGDDLGSITFWGNDDGTPSVQQYAGILAEISDASSGAEGGKLSLQVAEHDGTVTTGLLLEDGNADGEIDVTIGAGTSSLTTIVGDVSLSADASALKFGAGNDVTFTHDNGTGMDITSAGNLDIDCTAGSVTLGASLADGQTLKLGKNGAVETIIAPHGTAGSELYSVINTAGTTDGSDAAGSILLSAVAGGIGLAWADGKDLWAEGGRFVVVANEDASDCIKLHADAGTSQTIQIVNDAGTTDGSDDAGSIELSAAAGGIGLAWADDKDLWAEGGQAMIVANHNTADAIKLHADAGVNQTIVALNDEGTSESAITLTSTAGGIDLNANAAKDITLNGGQIVLTGAHNTAGTIKLHANAGVDEQIHLHADQGNGEGSSSSILLESDVGGIGLVATGLTGVMTDGNADAAIQLFAGAGGIGLRSTANLAGAIQIEADGGTSETIIIKADQGSSAASIGLISDAGGITLDAGLDITLSADGGNVTMDDGTLTIFDFDVDGTTMTIHDDQDTGDKFSIAVAQHGATTITTVDDDAAAADLTFTIDGDIVFQAEGTEVARAVGSATSSTTNCANAFTFKTPTISFTSDGTLYPSDSGAIVLLSAQDVTVTLPDSATAANLGTRYTFIVNNGDNGTKKIKCADATNEQILGRALVYDIDTAAPADSVSVFTSAPGGNNDFINFNGTTTGGIFSKIEIYATAADQWFVISSEIFATGTVATPFGNT